MLTSTGAERMSGPSWRIGPALLTSTLIAPNGAAAEAIASWQTRTTSAGTPGSASIGLSADGLLLSPRGWRVAGRSADGGTAADAITRVDIAAVPSGSSDRPAPVSFGLS